MKKTLYPLLLLICMQIATAYPTITEINPAIDSLMKQVNINSLETKIRYLQNLGPRPRIDTGKYVELHKNNITAKNWLYQQYLENGKLDVYYNHFLPENKCDTSWSNSMNIVAVQKGTEYPDKYIIICGHFDTGYEPLLGSIYESPGADDNASGTAAVLEIARILREHKFKRSIIYLNTNGEEIMFKPGMGGSRSFARNCKENDIDIIVVFNLDMIGYNPIGEPLKIYYNDFYHMPKFIEFGKYFSKIANLYLSKIKSLPTVDKYPLNGYGFGDDTYFNYYNYPAMYIGTPLGIKDWGRYGNYFPCYHRDCDTIGIGKKDAGVNSMELVKAYTQATLVAVVELAELDLIGIKEEAPINCFVSPNPANKDVTLTLYLADACNLDITLNNILGQEIIKIHNGFVDAGTFIKTFSIEALLTGMYYIQYIENNNIVKNIKLIKE